MDNFRDVAGVGGPHVPAAPQPLMRDAYVAQATRGDVPRLAKLLDAVPQLVWTASVDGRFLYCNSDVRRRLGPCEGYAVEYVIPERLVHSEDRQRWLGMWRHALKSGYPYEVEYRVRSDRDGIAHWYLERGTQVESAGSSDRWFVTATRIDEQKRREQELLALLLRKERFLVTLLHELRNPLAPIANATQLLAKCPRDPLAVNAARGVIERQLKQLTRLVNDLLDVSKLARGRIELQRAPADLREVIATAIEAAGPMVESRRHRLTFDPPSTAVVVDADPVRLCQVLTNLLINAAKYTNPEGRIWVVLEAPKDAAVVRVRDNGIGISIDLLPCIFDMFAQASSAADASMGGLGVGLAVARELVQLHGGSLSAHSDGLGCGSEFVVRLPRCDGRRASD
jgi:PAS domain S-box-containing protein